MVEPRRAVAGERLLGEGIGQFCPLIRHYVEYARLAPAGFFVSRDGIETSRFADCFRRHADDLVDDIISGGRVRALSAIRSPGLLNILNKALTARPSLRTRPARSRSPLSWFTDLQ